MKGSTFVYGGDQIINIGKFAKLAGGGLQNQCMVRFMLVVKCYQQIKTWSRRRQGSLTFYSILGCDLYCKFVYFCTDILFLIQAGFVDVHADYYQVASSEVKR